MFCLVGERVCLSHVAFFQVMSLFSPCLYKGALARTCGSAKKYAFYDELLLLAPPQETHHSFIQERRRESGQEKSPLIERVV